MPVLRIGVIMPALGYCCDGCLVDDGNFRDKGSDGYFSVVKLLPSAVTMLGLCSGLASIKCAFTGHWETAMVFIMVAAFMDAIDGRVARMLNSTTDFGAQLDSFADFLSFGVAPAFLLYFWLLRGVKIVGWVLVMVYVVCVAIRLARFNVSLCDGNHQDWKKHFFVGVPAPMGAMLALVPVMLTFWDTEILWLPDLLEYKNFIAFYFAGVALLLVSRIPTLSAKHIRIPKKYAYFVVTLLAILLILIVTNPWVTLPVMCLLYLISIPISSAYYMYINSKYNLLRA